MVKPKGKQNVYFMIACMVYLLDGKNNGKYNRKKRKGDSHRIIVFFTLSHSHK